MAITLSDNNGNKISYLNSRPESTLAAGAIFQGKSELVSSYGRAGVSIKSDNATDGVLTIEVSHDNRTWKDRTRSFADTSFAEPHMWNIIEKYFRIKYINGTTEAIDLSIQVQYSNNSDIFLAHQLNDALIDETESIITRSIGVGQDPLGIYNNFKQPGTAFVTTATVPAGVTFSSSILNAAGYSQVQTEILSDKDGLITLSFYSDSAGLDLVRQLTIPYIATDGYQFFAAPGFVDYIKYEFTNTEIADTTDFYFTTKFNATAINPQLLRTDGFISPAMISSLSRSIISGIDQDGVFQNVKTTRAGDINATITDSQLGFNTVVTPGGSLKTSEQTHLTGEAFGGVALNTSKWSIDLIGSGTQDATGSGELSLATGVTADSSVKIESVDVARFIPANFNNSHHAITIPDGVSYVSNNSRKWGAFNATSGTCNGVYFELDSGTWYVGHCLEGTPTRIVQSLWNGSGAGVFPNASITANVYEIEYNAGSIIYRVNGTVMHRANLLATPYANNIHFPAGMSNINSNGSTTDVILKLRAAAIYTLGKGKGVDRPYFQDGTTAGVLIKSGPGYLGKIIFSRNGAGGGDATILVYDALSATNQIGRLALDQDVTIAIDYDLNFNTGLYLVVTGSGTLGTTITFE